MFKYAIRVDIEREAIKDFVAGFNKKFKIEESNKYAWCFEKSKKVNKAHTHGYVESSMELKKSTVSDYMIKAGFKRKYSFQPVKEEQSYKDYIFKDRDIVVHTLSEDEYDSLIEKSMDIETDKKLSMCQKLFVYVSTAMEFKKINEANKYDICRCICQYFKENPKLIMPNKSQMFQYIVYIINQAGDTHEAWKMYSTYL